jgi:Xaa-Pro aminopeptidase
VSIAATDTRAARLLEAFNERGIDVLLVTDLVHVRWLTGFTGSNGVALLGRDFRVLLSDFRYVSQAAAELTDFEFRRGPRDLLDALPDLLGDGGVGLGFDDAELPVRRHAELSRKAPAGVELVAAGGIVEAARRTKDAGELERIRAAAALADEAMQALWSAGLAGRTEREVALQLEWEMRTRGAEAVSFEPIVAAGGHGALPHAQPRDVAIPTDTLVVLDWGARLDGYCSDCTRTVATGEGLTDEMRSVYELVRRAQAEARDAVRPGAGAADVDEVSRAPIKAAGYGDLYGHGLGHGVGLAVHEAPRLGPSSKDVLAEHEVVTVEPGVYVPGKLGVRIEDLVAVTANGCESYSSLPKTLTLV